MSRKAWVVMVGLTACGPGMKSSSTEPPPTARKTGLEQLLANTGDATKIAAQLAGPVTLGGVWFRTDECRSQFGQPGPVPAAQLPALAGCLATLPLKESARDSDVGGLRLVEYEPGLELEVMFARDEPTQIRYVGFVSRVLAYDIAPTITQQAFEATVPQRPLPDLGKDWLWAKVCLDEQGHVESVRPDLASSPAIVAPVIAQVKQWQGTPFKIGDATTAACSALLLATVPPPDAERYVPPVAEPGQGDAITVDTAALGTRVAGDTMLVPDDDDKNDMQHAGAGRTHGTVRFCVGTDGKVQGAWTAFPSGMADYDQKLIAGVKAWQYPPRAEPVCSYATFQYRQR